MHRRRIVHHFEYARRFTEKSTVFSPTRNPLRYMLAVRACARVFFSLFSDFLTTKLRPQHNHGIYAEKRARVNLDEQYCQSFFGKPVLSISDFFLIDKPFT